MKILMNCVLFLFTFFEFFTWFIPGHRGDSPF
jgi:hypothetical protein